MKRRNFLKLAGMTALSPALIESARSNQLPVLSDPATKKLYLDSVKANNQMIPKLLENQETEPAHTWYGGVPDTYGIHSAGQTNSQSTGRR